MRPVWHCVYSGVAELWKGTEVVSYVARLTHALSNLDALTKRSKSSMSITAPQTLYNKPRLFLQLPDIVQPMADNHITELESFSDVFLPPSTDVPFSSMDPSSAVRVGLPPRIVGRQLTEQMNSLDFVGCVPNPTWRRGSPYGSATRAAAGFRNLRQTRKVCQLSVIHSRQWIVNDTSVTYWMITSPQVALAQAEGLRCGVFCRVVIFVAS